jgi:cytochrome P450
MLIFHILCLNSNNVLSFSGFNYEFNSLTSSSELAEAYAFLLNSPKAPLRIFLRSLSNRLPFVRKLPLDEYKRFNDACKVIERVSMQLIEEKYRKDLDGKDLLSILINTNKTLPVEEQMTDDELKYQVIKNWIASFFY